MGLRVQPQPCPSFTFREFGKTVKDHLTSPLIQREITNHWQELLMIGGVLLAVISAAGAFFSGSYVLGLSFLAFGGLSATGAIHLHELPALKNIKQAAHTLSIETNRLSTLTQRLENENATLSQTNQDLRHTQERLKQLAVRLQRTSSQLSRTNLDLRGTNAALQNTNGQLQQTNTALSQQVVQLTCQVSQLRESAERIHSEVQLFSQGNVQFQEHLRRLNASVRIIEDQITSSRQLCQIITERLDTQSQGLGDQIRSLREFFRELSDQNAITQRLQQFTSLQTQILQSTQQLHAINAQFREDRARLEEIHNVLLRLREAFDSLLTNVNQANVDHGTQNAELRQNNAALRLCIQRLSALIPQPPRS